MTELKNLLARALAYIEDPSSLTDQERVELEEDLSVQINSMEKENDIDPEAVYVIINTDEPDDRQFWSNNQGWVGDLESATTWKGSDVHKVCPPMSGGWIKKEVFL